MPAWHLERFHRQVPDADVEPNPEIYFQRTPETARSVCPSAALLESSRSPATTPEIGVFDVQLTEAGATGVFFDGVTERFPVLHWHSAEIHKLPQGAQVLATAPACAVQAMRWGTRAFSTQFHLEADEDTITRWMGQPDGVAALVDTLGSDGPARYEAAARDRMSTLNETAERRYINWLQCAAQAVPA